MLVHSLRALLAGGCAPIVVVVPGDSIETARMLLDSDEVMVVSGGGTRQQSVRNGLSQIRSARVVVHDAARPFASKELFARVLAALDEGADGAAPALPVHETLKRVGDEAPATVPREGLRLTQTPQAFRTEILVSCHDRAAAESFEATDDCQLLEQYGHVVRLVEGSPLNLKVTYPEDLELADALARTAR